MQYQVGLKLEATRLRFALSTHTWVSNRVIELGGLYQ